MSSLLRIPATRELEAVGAVTGASNPNLSKVDSDLESPPEEPKEHEDPRQPRRKRDRMRGAFTSAKWMVTCPCIMVTWRFIQLGISLWQIGDMVSDAFLTEKFYRLARVRKNNTILLT